MIYVFDYNRLMSDIQQKWRQFREVFRYYMFVNSTQQPTYLLTRQHMGSYIAFGLAGYNTFLLRQKIIKNAISLTRSNHPRVVGVAAVGVGLYYFAGLCVMWHIPSFFAELAVRVYCSTENATTTVLFREYLRKQIFSDARIKEILKHHSD